MASRPIPVTHLLPEDLLTGVDLMDSQHAALFNLIVNVRSGMAERGLMDDSVRGQLFQLGVEIVSHFSTEETLAGDAGIAFASHRREHQRLVETFERNLAELLQGRMDSLGFLHFVDYWFENHIRQMDIPFGMSIGSGRD